jgi:DnaJ-class molecular chaperone
MTFGKRPVAPSENAQAERDMCPHCRGVGAIRGRGQRKVCVPCKGTGKRPEVPVEVPVEVPAEPPAAAPSG